MRAIALIIGLAFSSFIYSQVSIIPQPESVKMGAGTFMLPTSAVIISKTSDNTFKRSVDFLTSYLEAYYSSWVGAKQNFPPSPPAPPPPFSIALGLDVSQNPTAGSYTLVVSSNGIDISGHDEEGVFYGIQTFIQLLPPHVSNSKIEIPFLTIKDRPRFGYRGLHLDVGRHFMPVDFIKKYIDYIAYHKMNYFHWHLTEDQGWRIEIKKYPKLTSVGAWRNGTIIGRYPGTGNDNTKHGGFYTQDEVREIVKYAADRYIDVIPEIEMPGHGSAAIAAYPDLSCFPDVPTKNYFPKTQVWAGDNTGKQVQQTWGVFEDVFCAGKENTFTFLQDVLDEVIPLFPSKYVHVGGDECPKENWKKCPLCQQRMKKNNLKDEHELQSYFIQRMEKYINGKGKTLIGWDEILEGGLAPNAVVMSWRGEEGGIAAAKEKHKVIMTPGNWVYFDHTQSENEDSVTIGGFTTVEEVYGYEPIPAALQGEAAKYVLGAQANVWTEYMKNTRKVEYMIFPRMAALSEVLWSPKEKRNLGDFEKRLQHQFKRYELWNANYSKAYFDLRPTVLATENNDGVLWKLETKLPEAEIKYITHVANQRELTFAGGKKYSTPIEIKSSGLIAAIGMVNGKPVSNPVHANFYLNKATGKKISLLKEPAKNYPGDGAFTLVNGIQNDKGLARSKEFLGWSGEDMEAIIDLGSNQTISSAVVHSLTSGGSWVYPPQYAEILISRDGKNFTSVSKSETVEKKSGSNCVIKLSFSPVQTRYVKVFAKNLGIIPEGKQGASNKAWLFIDEIEINPPTP